jgi:hypothetical protein
VKKIIAKNDKLIYNLLADSHYLFHSDGRAFTNRTTTGKMSAVGAWREMSYYVKQGAVYISYRRVRLCLHRVIFAIFGGELDPCLVINHIDSDFLNNSIQNLELVSTADNNRHRAEHDRMERNFISRGNSKLTFEIANLIRELHEAGHSYNKLCRKFHVAKSTISDIVNFKIWTIENRARYSSIEKAINAKKYKKSMPSWVNPTEINLIYKNKPAGMTVDHIIPTISKLVCGLHVPWNLQYLPLKLNSKKLNKFDGTNENNGWMKNK